MVFKPQTFHEIEPTVAHVIPPEATLESDASAALAIAGGLDASDVTATAKGKQITLGGTVLRPQEVIRAEEVVLSVPGVVSVVNRIRAESAL
ncbi:BON domain-containing protein [Rhizobium sp. FY34]|uniref:BON domain-containing protein n=1 Tax=Rhizobium sp. FY34 TaxID=2562309 RepID=UPI0010C14A87|nr:BON domain-containing protein [Rhizobium sp. FY34]